MQRIGWLHVSDLHRGMSEHSWLWPNVEEQLFQDLAHLYGRTGPWELLFFSGDLVQRGTTDEFRFVTQTLRRLYEQLNALGCDPHLLVVPGNHDLKRPPSLLVEKMIADYTANEASRKTFWSDPKSEFRTIIKKAFQPFTAWNRNHQFKRPETIKAGSLPGDFAASVDINGVSVGIVGLNSTFLQLTEGNYEGRLAISTDQVTAVCGSNYPDWFKRHSFSILMTHQPLSWLSRPAAEILERDVLVPNRFLVHLCGHMHDPKLSAVALGGAGTRRSWQAASLFGLEYFEDKSGKRIERRHGYSVGSIEIQGGASASLRVWPRIGVRHQAGHWHFVQDPSASLGADGGTEPDQVRLNYRRAPVKQEARFKVLLLSTDHDLQSARHNVAEHLRKSLGTVVDETAAASTHPYDVSVLIQAWWWNKGAHVNEWRKAKNKKSFIFLIDESADWPPRKLVELPADATIKAFRNDVADIAATYSHPDDLPELVSRVVTEAMQQATGQTKIGLSEWERSYLEFRLPAWRLGRTAKSRPHLLDSEELEELYQPDLYVGLDGMALQWEEGPDGHPVRSKVKTKARHGARLRETRTASRMKLARWLTVEGLPRLALVGAPGGGKTIFLTRIAAALGNTCLGRNVQFEPDFDLERLRKEFGVPIPIVLEATRVGATQVALDTTNLLEAIIEEVGSGGRVSLNPQDVETGLKEGRYLLLIDALDEIADSRVRSAVLTLLKGISGVYPATRFVLTTRSARYTGELRFGPELETVEVSPLGARQVHALCSNWSVYRKRDAAYRKGLLAADQGLTEKVGVTGEDQALTENPLMLTAICMVYERYLSLPDDRGRLCELLIDDLCRSRRSEDPERSWKLDESGKKDLLQRIALEMQNDGAQSWPVDRAIQIARQLVPATEASPQLHAKKYVDWAADHTGILRFQEGAAGGEQIRFWHRLFREYLAATRIAQVDTTADQKVMELWKSGHLCHPFWEDVIRLLPRALGTFEKANRVLEVLEELAEEKPEHRGRLLGLAAAAIIENRDLFQKVVFSDMAKRMAEVYEAEGLTWRLLDRLLFLETLGRLDPRNGDPRLLVEKWISLSSDKASPLAAKESREKAVILNKPVTVQEFAQFVDSPSVMADVWWQDMPPLVQSEKTSLKERVQEQRRHPNWPIVDIGVGEAIAYCRWRTSMRNDEKRLRLPTVSELRSLFSKSRQKYYWGSEELKTGEEAQINWEGAQVGHPTPVGAFPPHPTGLLDPIGNVWEWCINTTISPRRKPARSFLVFGVSHSFDPAYFRLDRDNLIPLTDPPPEFEYTGNSTIGFRCVLSNFAFAISSVRFSRAVLRSRRNNSG